MLKKIVDFLHLSVTKINVPTVSITSTAGTLSMAKELYADAIYFRSQIDGSEGDAIKHRYRKAALIFFCASTEAWVNGVLRSTISNKAYPSSREIEILDFLEGRIDISPKDYSSIKGRLYNCLGKALTGSTISFGTESEFEQYIKLSDVRNAIAHYATRNRDVVYDQYLNPGSPNGLVQAVGDAPTIILNLCKRVHTLNSSVDIPAWVFP